MNVRLVTFGFVLIAFIAACDKKPEAASAPPAMPPMPVSVVNVQPTSIPMQIEAVAQTEGASEVEIRPRVGGIILKKCLKKVSLLKRVKYCLRLILCLFKLP